MSRWVPVEERLPEGPLKTLVMQTIVTGPLRGTPVVTWGEYGARQQAWQGSPGMGFWRPNRWEITGVTHWLDPHPLPGEEE